MEEIDFSIKQSYPAKKLLEEHFCWLFSAWSVYLRQKALGNTAMAKMFLEDMRKKHPTGSKQIVKVHRKRIRPTSLKTRPKEHCVLYHSQVVAFKKWVSSVIGPIE